VHDGAACGGLDACDLPLQLVQGGAPAFGRALDSGQVGRIVNLVSLAYGHARPRTVVLEGDGGVDGELRLAADDDGTTESQPVRR
jgi:hypothetical protein